MVATPPLTRLGKRIPLRCLVYNLNIRGLELPIATSTPGKEPPKLYTSVKNIPDGKVIFLERDGTKHVHRCALINLMDDPNTQRTPYGLPIALEK